MFFFVVERVRVVARARLAPRGRLGKRLLNCGGVKRRELAQ